MAYEYPFTQYLYFPSDIQSASTTGTGGESQPAKNVQWMNFHVVEYSKQNIQTRGAVQRKSTISLPMPQSFDSKYGAKWSETELGAVGNAVSAAASAMKAAGKTGSIRDILAAGGAIGYDSAGQIIAGATMDAIESIAPAMTGAAYQGLGYIRNPFNAILYQGPDFRTFGFDWKLYPRNEAESRQIYDIIKTLKVAMSTRHNDTTNALLDYPYLVQVQTANEDKTFKIATCAITGIGTNMQPDGRPNYFKSNFPAGVELHVSLQEMMILTQEEIAAGY
jgi:hypothetical protein